MNYDRVIAIDFETYYDSTYSLALMPMMQYILNSRFEVLCMGVAIRGEDSFEVVEQADVWTRLKELELDREDTLTIAHNAQFDISVIKYRYGIEPANMYCTMMGGGPSIRPFAKSMSLADQVRYVKQMDLNKDVRSRAKGRRRAEFMPEEWEEFLKYAADDAMACLWLYEYQVIKHHMTDDDLLIIHETIRKYTHPQLTLDTAKCWNAIEEETQHTEELLQALGATKKDLASASKFALMLLQLGVTPGMKPSPSDPSKETYAFAKTDEFMINLLKHDVAEVQLLAKTRLRVRSTITQTRLQRLLTIANAMSGYIPFPLTWYAAHTGRLGGSDKLNMQNLPRGSVLRECVTAPVDKVLVGGDLAQIEARLLAYVAGEDGLVKQFADGEDVYASFATELCGYTVTKELHPKQRFLGKTAILGLGYGCGVDKFDHMVESQGESTDGKAEYIVRFYRSRYFRIKMFWDALHEIITAAVRRQYMCKVWPGVEVTTTGNNLVVDINDGARILFYENLEAEVGSFGASNIRYGVNKQRIYGAKLAENIIQSMAGLIIQGIELKILRGTNGKLHAAGQVHDELIYVVDKKLAEMARKTITQVMCEPPDWLPYLPTLGEVKIGRTYKELK